MDVVIKFISPSWIAGSENLDNILKLNVEMTYSSQEFIHLLVQKR